MNLSKVIKSAIIFYIILLSFDLLIYFLTVGHGLYREEFFAEIMIVISAISAFLIAKMYYFRGSQSVRPLKKGLLLGLVMLTVLIIINASIAVYNDFIARGQIGWLSDAVIWFKTSLEQMISYNIRIGEPFIFVDWHWILAYLLILFIPLLVAYMKKK